MVSLGMLIARPLSIAVRRPGLLAGSAPPLRAATEISRMILVKILPRLASEAFLRPSMEGPRPMGKPLSCVGSRRFYWKPAPRVRGRLAALPRRVGVAAAAGPQELDRLRDRLGREPQAAVAGRHHHVVGQLRAAGFPHQNRAVVVALETRQPAPPSVVEALRDPLPHLILNEVCKSGYLQLQLGG